MSTITVYISSVSGSNEIKFKQKKILDVLTSKKYSLDVKDVAASVDLKQEMKDLVGDPKALPPQIFNGGVYCGDYDKFDEANECLTLNAFLGF